MADETRQPDSDAAHAPPGTLDVTVAADSPTSFSAMHPPPAPPAQPPAAPQFGAPAEPPAPPPVPHSARASFIVRSGILGAAVVTVVSTLLLFSSWYRHEDAAAVIVVSKTADWDGATVTVTGQNMPGSLTGVLSTRENMVVRFHVPPGHYTVRVARTPGTGAKGDVLTGTTKQPLGPLSTWWPFEAPEHMKRQAAEEAAAAAATTRPR